jgi:hypothetical protein
MNDNYLLQQLSDAFRIFKQSKAVPLNAMVALGDRGVIAPAHS